MKSIYLNKRIVFIFFAINLFQFHGTAGQQTNSPIDNTIQWLALGAGGNSTAGGASNGQGTGFIHLGWATQSYEGILVSFDLRALPLFSDVTSLRVNMGKVFLENSESKPYATLGFSLVHASGNGFLEYGEEETSVGIPISLGLLLGSKKTGLNIEGFYTLGTENSGLALSLALGRIKSEKLRALKQERQQTLEENNPIFLVGFGIGSFFYKPIIRPVSLKAGYEIINETILTLDVKKGELNSVSPYEDGVVNSVLCYGLHLGKQLFNKRYFFIMPSAGVILQRAHRSGLFGFDGWYRNSFGGQIGINAMLHTKRIGLNIEAFRIVAGPGNTYNGLMFTLITGRLG